MRRSGSRILIALGLAAAGLFSRPVFAADLDETGRLLAGVRFSPESRLAPRFRYSDEYANYARSINNRWSRYKKNTLDPVRTWVGSELSGQPDVVFYPFSGPDVLNALTFFPDGKTFILVGLESIGEVPRPETVSRDKTIAGLESLRESLTMILGVNFFRTHDMRTDLRAHPFAGTAGVILFFLSRLGCEVVDARRIALGPDGAVVDYRHGDRRDHLRGVEYRFRPPGAVEPRTVYYFQADLSDRSWTEQPELARFLSAQVGMVTLLKAASYLMWKPRFNEIREAILRGSRLVVQDASGVPFKYFEEGPWDVKLYGRYRSPPSPFQIRDQANLHAAMDKESRGPLPFVFGYDRRPSESHIIVAARRAQ